MQTDAIDGYLLEGRPAKGAAIAAALETKTDDPKAQPFYRALAAVGERAADEALIALRLVLAGKVPADDAVVALRALVRAARAGDAGARARYHEALRPTP